MSDINEETETVENNVDEYVRRAMRIKGHYEKDGNRGPSVDSLVLAITIEYGVNRLLAALENNGLGSGLNAVANFPEQHG